jgi:hypothetical protein
MSVEVVDYGALREVLTACLGLLAIGFVGDRIKRGR